MSSTHTFRPPTVVLIGLLLAVAPASAAEGRGIRLSWPVTSAVVPADSQLRVTIKQTARKPRVVRVSLLRRAADGRFVLESAVQRRSGTVKVPGLTAAQEYRLVARAAGRVIRTSTFRTGDVPVKTSDGNTPAPGTAPAGPTDAACTDASLAGALTAVPGAVKPQGAVTATWTNTGSCAFIVRSRTWISGDGTSVDATASVPEAAMLLTYRPGATGSASLVAPAGPGVYTLRVTIADSYTAPLTRNLDASVVVSAV